MSRSLLAISYRFPPETYPLAMRVQYVLKHLQQNWQVDAVTAADDASVEGVTVHRVRPREASGLIRLLGRLRLQKLTELFLWPDPFVFWIFPALLRAWRLVRTARPDALIAFSMPYSSGVAGVLLKKLTGLPLVLNLNDSPTCTDMNAVFPSRLHYQLAHWLENWLVRNADAVIYVSRRNMERVRDRQPAAHRSKFHLIRRGVRPLPSLSESPSRGTAFRILYTGGMSGWHFGQAEEPADSFARQIYKKWLRWGKYAVEDLDPSTHSPLYIGKALRQVVEARPEWRGRLSLEIYGNTFPDEVVRDVLQVHGLQDLVHVHGKVSHESVLRHIQEADLLFMTLPGRVQNTPGGRISAKTYEYLMTDRPILAALPPGENTEFLREKPGVYLTSPWDSSEMADIISNLASKAFNGDPLSVDRRSFHSDLLSTSRAEAFESVVETVVDASRVSTPPPHQPAPERVPLT